MESKKINQLATELAPDLSDLTIIGDPTTGISKKITLSQMASLFTGTVEEYATLAAFPLVGVADTIYIALDTNIIYRYDTSLSAYVILSPNIINSLVFSDANGFDGTITLVGSVATLSITTALTLGSVPFIGASGALTQDNANLFFDDTNNRLGIATASPTTPLDVFGSGIIGRLNATSTNNAYLGFASNGTNKWSAGNVQSDHRFRIFSEANSAELITILQTGEFGIGISNPTTKFHIDGAASALIANLDANVSVAKSLSYRSDNSARINLEVSGTESGSNAGADFFLRTFTDAGSLLETPFQIVRSTGLATFKNIAITGLTSGYLPKANGSSALSNSLIYENGTNVLIGSTTNDFGILGITTSNAVGFTSALGIGFRTNVAEGDSVGISFKTKISLGGTIWENARIAAITESVTTSANGALTFYTMNATVLGEKMRITPLGNVAISTISPNIGGYGTNSRVLTIQGVSGSYAILELTSNSANADGNAIGRLDFGSDGQAAGYKTNSSIASFLSGSTSTKFGSDLRFYTRANNAAIGDPIQRLIIASTGDATFTESVTATAFTIPSGGFAGTRTILSGENTNTGATGRMRILLQNSTTNFFIEKYGTGFTSSGIATQAGSAVYDDGAGGMSIGATNGSGTLRLFGGNAEVVRITSAGNVGINSVGASNYKLIISSADDGSSNFGIGIFNSAGSTQFRVRNDGAFFTGTAASSPYNLSASGRTAILESSGVLGYLVSTRESKANIKSIENVDYLNQLNPVCFNYRKKDLDNNTYTDELYDNITYGFIADEVEKVNKDLVFYNENGTLAGVEYNSMIAILTKAVQELKAEIDILKAK